MSLLGPAHYTRPHQHLGILDLAVLPMPVLVSPPGALQPPGSDAHLTGSFPRTNGGTVCHINVPRALWEIHFLKGGS